MKLSLRAKVGLAVAGTVGFLLFLIVVDLGVNAGRIHYGVSVAGEDLGGLTRVEAREALVERANDIREQPVALTAEGLNVPLPAECVGWRPYIRGTIRRAYAEGREHAPLGALSDRVSAWLWGIQLRFSGGLQDELLELYMDEWDARLGSVGEPLDRRGLRRLLLKAFAEGETGPFEFPRRPRAESSALETAPDRLAAALLRRVAAPRRAAALPPRVALSEPALRGPLRSPHSLPSPMARQDRIELPEGCPDPTQEPFS